MNGDRLLLDRSSVDGSVNMRVVLSDKPALDTSRDWTLKAPMPPHRPLTLSEEIKERRLARRVDKVGGEIYGHVREYVFSRCDADDTIDEAALERDLWRFFMTTTPRFDGLADGDSESV